MRGKIFFGNDAAQMHKDVRKTIQGGNTK